MSAPRRSNLLTVLMLGVLAYFLLPVVWLVVASTKSNSGLFRSFGLWFDRDFALGDNLRSVFTRDDGVFVRWLVNTFAYAGLSAVGATVLATMAGYAFAKYTFPGGRLLFNIVLGAVMIPTTALAIPTYLLFSNAGLTNTPWAIILRRSSTRSACT